MNINLNLNNYDFTRKLLFIIHIPKTGGTALNESSRQIINLSHAFNVSKVYRIPKSLRGHEEYISDRWPVYIYPKLNHYKITVIRNPFDLLCSYYFHGEELKDNDEYSHSGWASVNYTHKFKSFKEFIIAYCDENFKWHVPALKNFLYSQLFDNNFNCVADFIIKYEYLNDAIDEFNKKLTFPIKKNHKANVSNLKKNNYKDYYDEEMINLVSEKCKKELIYFNYNFEGSTKYEPIFNTRLKYDVHKNVFNPDYLPIKIGLKFN